jgi:hypothetical protein
MCIACPTKDKNLGLKSFEEGIASLLRLVVLD